jgi:polyphenol oxidase
MSLPQLDGAFEWTEEPWGKALRCTAIASPHLFSTRDLEICGANLQPSTGWDQLAASLGLGAGDVLRPRQVHGDGVTIVPAAPVDAAAVCASAADIITTAHIDRAVAVQSADCVPLLFFDSRTGAAAAAHAGWRGTAAGVAGKAMNSMAAAFGTRPGDVIVAIGPSIGPCCYRVGDELLAAFGPNGRRWFYRVKETLMLNLWNANRDQLLEAGVTGDHIHVAGLCTADDASLFHSYRRDGAAAGRLVAAIRPLQT